MGLEKSIASGKERRRPYHGAKAVDTSCRNHGDCDWCKGNRLYSRKKKEESVREQLEEYKKEPNL